MGTDARVLATGFVDVDDAEAVAAAVRPSLMGPTRVSALGTHHALDPGALCWGVEAVVLADATVAVEVSTPLRWKEDPQAHEGLGEFIGSCVRAFEGRQLHYTSDAVTSELRYGDGILVDEVTHGTALALPA